MKIKLNKIQRQAVETNKGPVLIFAGAGSGKTKVLTQKIHRLIEIEKFKPENILSVTFTNKAAKEMKTRVMSLLKTEKLRISIGTFHSICARLIRNEAKNIGLNPQFAIYDVQDQLDLYKIVLKVLNISKDTIKPNQARNQISFFKNKMITPEEQLKKWQQENLNLLDKHFNWERFCAQVLNEIENEDTSHLVETDLKNNLFLLLAEYRSPSFWLRPPNLYRYIRTNFKYIFKNIMQKKNTF